MVLFEVLSRVIRQEKRNEIQTRKGKVTLPLFAVDMVLYIPKDPIFPHKESYNY
jgi:hypothetical protein